MRGCPPPQTKHATSPLNPHSDEDGAILIASVRKLRAAAGFEASFTVPHARLAAEGGVLLAVHLASNAVSEAAPPVAYRVEVAAPDGAAVARDDDAFEGAAARARGGGAAAHTLCLDGGGARGVVTLALLSELERDTGRRVCEMFGAFAGTSTGALIAAALSAGGMSVDVLSHLYLDLSALLFSSRLSTQQRALRLRAVAGAVLGPAAARPLGGADPRGAQRPTPSLMMVATDTSVAPWRPFVFRNYELLEPARSELEDAPSFRAPMVEALCASAAAPTIFPRVNLTVGDCEHKLVDGGLVANNPTLLALVEAAESPLSKGACVSSLVSLIACVSPFRLSSPLLFFCVQAASRPSCPSGAAKSCPPPPRTPKPARSASGPTRAPSRRCCRWSRTWTSCTRWSPASSASRSAALGPRPCSTTASTRTSAA